MKAAILKEFGSPLYIQTLPDLILGTGEIIVDVLVAPVLSYANEVISGKRRHFLKLPIALGCGAIGRMKAIGPDATNLKTGDIVLCDPTVRSRDNIKTLDIALQGWTATNEASAKLQSYFHHGSFAEQILLPTENAFRIGPLDETDALRYGVLPVPCLFLTVAFLLRI